MYSKTIATSFLFSILMFTGIAFAAGFQDLINTLDAIGVFKFYLPFIIVFAVIYGLLQKVKIFGEGGKPINIILALGIALFVMVYVPVGIAFSEFLTRFAGNTVVVLLTIIVAVLFISVVRSEEGFGLNFGDTFKKGWGLWVLFLITMLIVFGVFVASGGTSIFPGIKISDRPTFNLIVGISPTMWAIIILIVGTGLIVFFLPKEKPAAGGKGP